MKEPDVEEIRPTTLTDHAVLIGYGRVGSLVGDALKEVGKPFLVIEDADKTVAKLHDDDIETIVGNAANGDILAAANLAGARQLITCHSERIRGRADRRQGTCCKSGHQHSGAGPFGCRSTTFAGPRCRCSHYGRTRDRTRHRRPYSRS